MITVVTYGTFDLFHIGHLRLLERAAALGDRLVVGVSTDEFTREKGKTSIQPYEERVRIVAALRVVDAVFPEKSWDQKPRDIKRWQADVSRRHPSVFQNFDEMLSALHRHNITSQQLFSAFCVGKVRIYIGFQHYERLSGQQPVEQHSTAVGHQVIRCLERIEQVV